MQKIEVAAGIVQYRFSPHEGKQYGFNLTVLRSKPKREALLIDTGYEEHASAVRDDLMADGYSLRSVIISHFHPDHILGLTQLSNVEVLGSPRCEETLMTYGARQEWASFAPTRHTSERHAEHFGPFELRFRFAPGHAPCSQYTLIDEGFVHVADNVMTSNDGQDILPWAPFDEISAHIQSLELLRAQRSKIFLLSHGVVLGDEEARCAAIDNRVRYFQNVLEGGGSFDYERTTRGCTCDFLHQEWLIRTEPADD